MSFQWQIAPDVAWSEMTDRYRAEIEQSITALATRLAPEIADWMKANHPWTNQTGAAEAGLHTEVEVAVGDAIHIILSHGVDYGLWLEIRNAGRYSVLGPALDVWGPRIWQIVQQLLRR